MTNSGIIEGHAGNSSGCSDLNLAISSCQSVPNPPMNVGDWATIGRAANHAGQHSNRATTVWWIAGAGGGKGLWPVVALKQTSPHYRRNPINPYAEKEARLRPQLFTFGSGDYSFANASESFKGWEADEVALPRS